MDIRVLRVYMSRDALDYRGTDLPPEYAVQDQTNTVLLRSESLTEVREFAQAKASDEKMMLIDFTLTTPKV